MISLENVSKIYPSGDEPLYALENLNLKVEQGEYVAIIGPSGSGKSTLINIIGCLDRPSRGRYFFEGRNVAEFTADQLALVRGSRIGFIFQGFNLLPRLTALENVELPLIYQEVPSTERHDRAELALRRVGLGGRLTHKPGQLSGGQQQRVAIARALVTGPSLLLADEPTGNLDGRSGEEVMELLCGLNTQGNTLVLITHDMKIAHQAGRVVAIADGKLASDSSWAAEAASPAPAPPLAGSPAPTPA